MISGAFGYLSLERARPPAVIYLSDRSATTDLADSSPLDALQGLAGYVYLATPYTRYPLGLEAAAYDAARYAAKLMKRGLVVYSPIAHSHAVAKVGYLDAVDEGFWKWQDQPMVDMAAACIVLMLDGWRESRGVSHEIACFEAAGKPIVYVRPEAL